MLVAAALSLGCSAAKKSEAGHASTTVDGGPGLSETDAGDLDVASRAGADTGAVVDPITVDAAPLDASLARDAAGVADDAGGSGPADAGADAGGDADAARAPSPCVLGASMIGGCVL
jgi:hypothetical protein